MSAARGSQAVRRRRTGRDILAGIAAVLALAVLVVGVPFALVTLVGWPLPKQLPTLRMLTQPIGVGTIIDILAILVWLAWVQLTVCVIVEMYAGIRGVGLPTQVPLAGGTQAVAHRLVAAILLLFTATTVLVPALSNFGGEKLAGQSSYAVTAVTGAQADAASQMREQGTVYTQAEDSATTEVTKIYTVQPPQGRHHESLWEIAERYLGDGRQYREIYRLNEGRQQPDGSSLDRASLIRPGWVLVMPDSASGPGIETIREDTRPDTPGGELAAQAHASAQHDAGEQAPQVETVAHADEGAGAGGGAGADVGGAAASGGAAGAAAGGADVDGEGTGAGEQVQAAQQLQPAEDLQATQQLRPASELLAEEQAEQAEQAGQHDSDWGFSENLASATLLAAGVLAALGRRRRQQLWNRAFGSRITGPDGDAAEAEGAMRMSADHEGVRFLDLALRQLSQELGRQGRTFPTVYAAHLSEAGLDLWIVPADTDAPAPWQVVDSGQVWRFPSAAADDLDAGALSGTLAPYPGLVTLGTNDAGRVLVDLETAQGLISVRGSEHLTQQAVAALAVELATNGWSDQMRVTLVGFGAELATLAPERVRSVATLDEALPEIEARAEETRQAMEATGIDSVLTGRCRGMAGEQWTPHYVLMASPPGPDEAQRVAHLGGAGRQLAAGFIVAGDVPGAAWSWDLDDEGTLQAGVLGMQADAQLLPQREYDAVVELFRAAGQLEGTSLGRGADGPLLAALPDLRIPAAAEVKLLGETQVYAPGALDEERAEVCTEVVTYLATHPDGVHPTVLGGAIWPRGVTPEVRDATIARVVDWLGRDYDGNANLYVDERDRLRLGPGVRVDWLVFRTLVHFASRDSAGEQGYLSQALDLVRGPLLAGRPRTRYAWLAAEDLEYESAARVADAAHRLAWLRFDENDPFGAANTLRRGLRLAGNDEMLWRDLLHAASATGEQAHVRSVVAELQQRVAEDPEVDAMQPETEALIDELLPSWRLSVAS